MPLQNMDKDLNGFHFSPKPVMTAAAVASKNRNVSLRPHVLSCMSSPALQHCMTPKPTVTGAGDV
jgi:hypothetical protein